MNTGGLSPKQYSQVRQFLSITKLALVLGMNKNVGELVYDKEFRKRIFGVNLKYKGLIKQFLNDEQPKVKDTAYYEELIERPTFIKSTNMIINFYSKLGDEANNALTKVGMSMYDHKMNVGVTDGITFNIETRNFQGDGWNVNSFLKGKDVIIFFAVNSIIKGKEGYGQDKFDELLQACNLKSIPILMSSNEKRQGNVINIECTDSETSAHALFMKLKEKK